MWLSERRCQGAWCQISPMTYCMSSMRQPWLLLGADPQLPSLSGATLLSSASQVQVADLSGSRLQGHAQASISPTGLPPPPSQAFLRLARLWCWAAAGAPRCEGLLVGHSHSSWGPACPSCWHLHLSLGTSAGTPLLRPLQCPRVGPLAQGTRGLLQGPPGSLGPEPQAFGRGHPWLGLCRNWELWRGVTLRDPGGGCQPIL